MSWFSKKLKKLTKIADPIGDRLRKSTGGSYGDPMNWYNSKPNQTQPWQPAPSQGLMPQPSGPAPQGVSFGQNTGGRTYTPNPFAGGNMAPPTGAMTFGGGPQMSSPGTVVGPNVGITAEMGGPQNPMAQQMKRIGVIRGSAA